MKKIVNICLFLAAAATFTACSDDNTGSEYTRENTVSVVSADLSFDANAHTGGVKFNAPAGAVVTVNKSWATAELKGDSVVVNVTNNPALESRAAMLTIKSGADSTNVPISQEGCQFSYTGKKEYVLNDDAQTLVLPYTKVGAEPTVATNNAVLAPTDADTAFVVSLPANTTGSMQQDSFYVSNQGIVDTVIVKRGEKKDFVGQTCYLAGYDLAQADENTQSLSDLAVQYAGTIKTDTKGNPYLYAPKAYIKNLPLTFDESTLTFTVTGGQLVNTLTSQGTKYYLRSGIWDYTLYEFLGDLTYQYYQYYQAGKITEAQYKQFQAMMPQVFAMFDSKKLSMVASMNVDPNQQIPFGDFVDSGNNDWLAEIMVENFNYTHSNYDANILALDLNTVSNGAYQFDQPLALIALPELIIIPSSQAKANAAKYVRSQVRRPNLSPALLKHQAVMNKVLKMNKALKFEK